MNFQEFSTVRVNFVTVMGLSHRGIAAIKRLEAQRPLRVSYVTKKESLLREMFNLERLYLQGKLFDRVPS